MFISKAIVILLFSFIPDAVTGYGYPDDDSDGTPNGMDMCPKDPEKIYPGACGCGNEDIDKDGDNYLDCQEECPEDPFKFLKGPCGCGIYDNLFNSDGSHDCSCSSGDCDEDGQPNGVDSCPLDPKKILPGGCGCGVEDIDRDGDNYLDCQDECPDDPYKFLEGVCGCGKFDNIFYSDGTNNCDCDSGDCDDDGASNGVDACPFDSEKILPGGCGCGVPDIDSDGDGLLDCFVPCPDPEEDFLGYCGCEKPENWINDNCIPYNFDDVTFSIGSFKFMPYEYRGMHWDNCGVLNTDTYNFCHGTAYCDLDSSDPNVLFPYSSKPCVFWPQSPKTTFSIGTLSVKQAFPITISSVPLYIIGYDQDGNVMARYESVVSTVNTEVIDLSSEGFKDVYKVSISSDIGKWVAFDDILIY